MNGMTVSSFLLLEKINKILFLNVCFSLQQTGFKVIRVNTSMCTKFLLVKKVIYSINAQTLALTKIQKQWTSAAGGATYCLQLSLLKHYDSFLLQ